MYGDYDQMRAWARGEANGTSVADEWDRSWTGPELAETFDPYDPDQAQIMRDVIETDARTDREIRERQLVRRVQALSARLEEIDPEFDPDEVL